jgi:hemoglobin
MTPNPQDSVTVNGIHLTHQDIYNVVNDFYTRVPLDPLLKVPFGSVADWPEHIDRLTQFWWTRFGGRSYMFSEYNPALKHFFAGFNRELLTRWLAIFHDTLEKHLTTEQAALWKGVSERMGEGLAIKNDYLKAEFEKRRNQKSETE